MIWSALLKTVALYAISILIEIISATKEGKTWFENLKRPKYSFSFRAWYVVGAVYYIIFGILAYRQFSLGKSFASLSIILLVAVMVLNGLGNFVIFKYRSIKWFYLVIYPFALILLTLIVILWKDDMVSLQFGRAALLPKGEAIIPPEPSCSLMADSFDPFKVLTLLNTLAITENNSKIN